MRGVSFFIVTNVFLCSCAMQLNSNQKIIKGFGSLIEVPALGRLITETDKEPILISYPNGGEGSIEFRSKKYILGKAEGLENPKDRRDSTLSVYLYLLAHFDEDIFIRKSVPIKLNYVTKGVKHEKYACEFKHWGRIWLCKVFTFNSAFSYFNLQEQDSTGHKGLGYGNVVIDKFDYQKK